MSGNYTCSVCDKEFDEEEYKLTNDSEKCILHCEKDDWHQVKKTILGPLRICDEKRFEIFREKFIENFTWENNSSLRIQNIHFPYNPIVTGGSPLSLITMNAKLKEIYISKCVFYGDENIELNRFKTYELEKMQIFDIHSNYKLSFSEARIKDLTITTSNIDTLHIQFSNFEKLHISGHFSDKQYRTIKNINIVATSVKDDCWIYELKLDRLRLHSVNFFKTTLEKLYIYEELEVDKSKFENRLDFFDVEYLGDLNLEKTLIPNETSFLTLTSNSKKKKIVNVMNRETARKIKHSFDNIGNIIEANKYYALEMEKRSEELSFFKKPLEWLVFKVHGISSNYSQNWILALFWIISIPFIYILFGTVDNIDSIVYNIHIKGFWNEIANLINPFSIMTGPEKLKSFLDLFYKVTIAYLIYQFIISIRQNTRRK